MMWPNHQGRAFVFFPECCAQITPFSGAKNDQPNEKTSLTHLLIPIYKLTRAL